MDKTEIYQRVHRAVRVRHFSWKTGEAYAQSVVIFQAFLNAHRELASRSSEEKVRAFLEQHRQPARHPARPNHPVSTGPTGERRGPPGISHDPTHL